MKIYSYNGILWQRKAGIWRTRKRKKKTREEIRNVNKILWKRGKHGKETTKGLREKVRDRFIILKNTDTKIDSKDRK